MEIRNELRKVPFRNIDEIGPAGSINSSVDQMIRYVAMHINKGKHGDKNLIPAAFATQMQSAQTVTPGEPPYTELSAASYGMGLSIQYYRGRKMVSHGGGIDGFTALLTFMPNEKIGMVILTNRGGSTLPTVVSRYIYDRLLGLDTVNWTQRLKEQQEKARGAAEEERKKRASTQRAGTRPSHEWKEYAGTFEHPAYGVVRIEADGDALRIIYNGSTNKLAHYHYDFFEVPEEPGNPMSGMKISFATNVRGEIASVALPLEPSVKDIVFTRREEKKM
jgi:CubicO group peptidase (beta-lactamase class C family)